MKIKVLSASLFLATLMSPAIALGYGVLSHEEIVDICWESDIRPALVKHFPNASDAELKQAHAYAYGGSVIQDIGYYPFGSHEFTNYLHYVRSGDFVANMLRDATNLNEYAFALGALSHYAADSWGHPAVNAGVGAEYPRLRAKYGPIVTYEDDHEAHLETEFSFDVVQVAKKRYLSKQYHDFIGFQVPQDLITRSFLDTYGVKSSEFLKTPGLAIGTYRFGVSRVIPEMTQVAITSRQIDLPQEKNDQARQQFLYHLSRADYEREFGSDYRGPGLFARILGFLLHHLIPRFGPFKALSFKDPTSATEDEYFKSLDNVVSEYHRLVRQVENGDYKIPDRNLDVGDPTKAGKYELADQAYDDLLRRLAKDKFTHLTPDLKSNIVAYFASGSARDKLSRHKWKQTKNALAKLKEQQSSP
ncbi:MAG: zinc dependent phospholipase C family protein [Acidobacteriaceae bacterium]|nr:zinc dependent phospholipase C family protein [Acidobacteriaceae bacterium]